MTRRMLLLSSLASLARADSAQQVWELFGSLASALSAANPQLFLAEVDKSMPGYQKLSDSLTGLLREFEIQSSVDFNRNEGDDQKREVEANWLMLLRPLGTANFTNANREALASERREQILKCKVEKKGRKWKLVAMEPIDFFAPPAA